MSSRTERIAALFGRLHGVYGNKFLEMFRTGQIVNGHDTGVHAAMGVWRDGLTGFSDATLGRALEGLEAKHKTFPPTLWEFRDLCRAHMPRRAEQANLPALPTKEQAPSEWVQRVRDALDANRVKKAGDVTLQVEGIPAVSLLIARAMSLAGADEAKALSYLEGRNR